MTSADFSFVECSFDPNVCDRELVHVNLCNMGFSQYKVSLDLTVSVWIQNLAVIMLTEVNDESLFEVSGLGFITTPLLIQQLDAQRCPNTGMYVINNECNLRTWLVAEEDIFSDRNFIESNFITDLKQKTSTSGIDYFSGLMFTHNGTAELDFYKTLNFTVLSESTGYYTLQSDNKRFTLVCSEKDIDTTAICETKDIFYTAAFCANNNIRTSIYNQQLAENQFGSLTYKIKGYDCLAHGSMNSFSIEKLAKDIAPNLNIIFRMRQQYAVIDETMFKRHFENDY